LFCEGIEVARVGIDIEDIAFAVDETEVGPCVDIDIEIHILNIREQWTSHIIILRKVRALLSILPGDHFLAARNPEAFNNAVLSFIS